VEPLAVAAGLHRIGEAADVSARLPHARVADDGAVEPDDLELAAVRTRRRVPHHGVPPRVAEVVLQLDAERPVVPEAVDAAVDLRGLEDEATTAAEGDEALHQRGPGRRGHALLFPKARGSSTDAVQ
jgi:hypothetical protein